ncbi:MAG: endonuclease/exonuclease/phosphatase family protein [Rubrobacteraceae bacterium]
MRVRIATFNLENLDDERGEKPSLEERIELMRPQLVRVDADILCLQEVNAQERDGKRGLFALEELLADTEYSDFEMVSTTIQDGSKPFAERNLAVLSRFEIVSREQHKHDYAPAPLYRMVTASEPDEEGKDITWERPILRARVRVADDRTLDVINLHLKSKLPTDIEGQKKNPYTWKTASGWAEGFFVSSMKRVGQALETRMLIDELFEEDEDALIVCCGDFNADLDEVPVQAIRGDVENTGNGDLSKRVMVPTENTIPESSRYSLFHMGRGEMIDHLLVSRSLLQHHRGSEIHNELLHDESMGFATDKKYPESDHAPVIAEFEIEGA